MSRLPASYLPPALQRRKQARPRPAAMRPNTTPTPPTQPAHLQLKQQQSLPSEPEPAVIPHRVWLVFLLGVILGAAVLASQVDVFLRG